MCPDLPCVGACPTGALRLDVPVGMGTAIISPPDCLAHQNDPCSACVEQCPVPGAISWADCRPTVRQEACTGCGVCQHVCPAPRNAVILVPRRQRPLPPVTEVPHGE
jgi:Pyruvate/2-oxoacid:ferredoxin oxidoreductase delta subunit